jgi:fumarate reductase subunit D
MDINKENAVHKITTLTVYVGTFLLVIGFTVYSIYSADKALEGELNLFRAQIIVIAIIVYSLIATLVAASWITGLIKVKRSRDEYESRLRCGFIK